MIRYLVSIFLVQLILFLSVQGQTGIDVDIGDNPLVITSGIDGENGFTGNLRLMANGSDIDNFSVLATDLKENNGSQLIRRNNIALTGDLKLKNGMPKDFLVTVTDVKEPGIYRGKLELFMPGDSKVKMQTVDLVVVARTQAKLVPLPGSDKVDLNLANSNSPMARLMLPASAFMNSWDLLLENPTQSQVTIIQSNISLVGQTGFQLTSKEISLPEIDPTFPAQGIGTLTILIIVFRINWNNLIQI